MDHEEAVVIELADSPVPLPRRQPPNPPHQHVQVHQAGGFPSRRRDTSSQTEYSTREPSMDSLLLMIEQQRMAYEQRLHQVSSKEVALAIWESELKKRAAALDEQEDELRHMRRQQLERNGPVTELPWSERLALAQSQVLSRRSDSGVIDKSAADYLDDSAHTLRSTHFR